MKKNVGKIDIVIRRVIGFFLVWLGLFQFNGLEGNVTGIIIAAFAILPFYVACTGSCPVFSLWGINTFSKSEKKIEVEEFKKSN